MHSAVEMYLYIQLTSALIKATEGTNDIVVLMQNIRPYKLQHSTAIVYKCTK